MTLNLKNNKLNYIESTNPYLINIKKRKTLASNSNYISEENKENKHNAGNCFDFKSLIETLDSNNQFIKDLKHALETTFFIDTVFKLVNNKYFTAIKCMVIKQRNLEREYNNPHLLLEWENLYSESRGEFKIVYFFFDESHGKICFTDENNNTIQVINQVFMDKTSNKQMNICINLFRNFYLS